MNPWLRLGIIYLTAAAYVIGVVCLLETLPR